MTQEDIIRMAKRAGIAQYGLGWTCWEGQLERFAALVAAHEREACAKVCEPLAGFVYSQNTLDTMKNCAAAIRARGNK